MNKNINVLLIVSVLLVNIIVGCRSNKENAIRTSLSESIVISDKETNTSSENKTEEMTTTPTETTLETIATTAKKEEVVSTEEQQTTTAKQEETTVKQNVYTYSELDKKMYAKSSVNVRILPSTDGEKIGSLSKGQEVIVTGQCNETKWYRIIYKDKVAYVSSSYLVNDKPEEETTKSSETTKDKFVEYHNSFGCGAYGSSNCESGEQRYCARIFDIHYEVTEEVDRLIGKCETQKVKEWFEMQKGYYNDDGTVTLWCCFSVAEMAIEEFNES